MILILGPQDIHTRRVAGTELFALEIRSQTPGYVFTGIDPRRTPDGECVFFEGNPTPVFVYDGQASGFPISDRPVDLLMAG